MPGDRWHAAPMRVYYEDTDAGGVMYHAAYLRFAERGRTEYLRTLGIDHRALRETHGIVLAVRRCAVVFRRPARLDDVLEVATRLTGRHGAAVRLEQRLSRGREILAELRVTVACVGADGALRRPPPAVAAMLPHLRRNSH